MRHLTASQLAAHYHEHYSSRPPVIAVVGQFDVQRVLHRLIAAFPVDPEPRTPVPLAGDVVHEQPLDSTPRFLELDRSQVQVVRTAPGIAIGDEREPNSRSCSRCLAVAQGAFLRLERRSRANLRGQRGCGDRSQGRRVDRPLLDGA